MDKIHAQALLNLIAELYLTISAPEPETKPEPSMNGADSFLIEEPAR